MVKLEFQMIFAPEKFSVDPTRETSGVRLTKAVDPPVRAKLNVVESKFTIAVGLEIIFVATREPVPRAKEEDPPPAPVASVPSAKPAGTSLREFQETGLPAVLITLVSSESSDAVVFMTDKRL